MGLGATGVNSRVCGGSLAFSLSSDASSPFGGAVLLIEFLLSSSRNVDESGVLRADLDFRNPIPHGIDSPLGCWLLVGRVVWFAGEAICPVSINISF